MVWLHGSPDLSIQKAFPLSRRQELAESIVKISHVQPIHELGWLQSPEMQFLGNFKALPYRPGQKNQQLLLFSPLYVKSFPQAGVANIGNLCKDTLLRDGGYILCGASGTPLPG